MKFHIRRGSVGANSAKATSGDKALGVELEDKWRTKIRNPKAGNRKKAQIRSPNEESQYQHAEKSMPERRETVEEPFALSWIQTGSLGFVSDFGRSSSLRFSDLETFSHPN